MRWSWVEWALEDMIEDALALEFEMSVLTAVAAASKLLFTLLLGPRAVSTISKPLDRTSS